MQGVVLLIAALSASTHAVTYKCKDAQGHWTSQACLIVVPMEETPYMRWRRENQAELDARARARDRLGPYCFRIDTKASFYDCVDAQMKIYDQIRHIAASLPFNSVPRLLLADCVTRNVDSTSGATDYRQALECYRRQ